MNLELRHYQLFTVVAERRSFSAAARELHTSQPTVSRGVAAIERRLGVQLVARTTRNFSLTPAGERLYAEARHVLDTAAAAEARTIRASGRRRIVLGVKPDSAAEILERVLATCAGAPYHLDVDVSFHETHELPTAVRQGECDAGMVAWPAPAAELSSALLWEEPRVAILPASHPLASAPAPLPLAQLALEPVARWPHLPVELDHYYQGLDTLAPVDQQRRPRVAGLAQALRLVELGRAITFLPSSVAQRFSRPGLAVRPVAGLSPNRMYLIWGHRNNSQELQHLLEICRATTPDAIVNTAS